MINDVYLIFITFGLQQYLNMVYTCIYIMYTYICIYMFHEHFISCHMHLHVLPMQSVIYLAIPSTETGYGR